uniref:Uncharacterized protein n=2 Tax=viral metagenome TaxID=1070528 RepID=A0A6M3JL57_9ZZZZ
MDEQGGEAIIKKTQEEGMKIGTKYQIISDSTNVTLQERGYNKTKKEHSGQISDTSVILATP